MCATKIEILAGHDCETAREAGFGGATNGELLAQAEFLFDVLVTIDRNLRYQQNVTARDIAILVLCAHSNDISDLAPLMPGSHQGTPVDQVWQGCRDRAGLTH